MKRYFMLLPLLLCFVALSAQTSMREIWLSMPDSMIPYLNKNLRLEHVELLEMKVESKVRNLLGGEGKMDSLTSDYMQIHLNGAADMQLRLLPKNDSLQMICMVKTVRAQQPESEIRFFDLNWNPINDLFGLPLAEKSDSIIASFFLPNDTISMERVQEMQRSINPVMFNASLLPDAPELILQLSPSLKTVKEAADVKAVLRQKKYKWDGKLFKEC